MSTLKKSEIAKAIQARLAHREDLKEQYRISRLWRAGAAEVEERVQHRSESAVQGGATYRRNRVEQLGLEVRGGPGMHGRHFI